MVKRQHIPDRDNLDNSSLKVTPMAKTKVCLILLVLKLAGSSNGKNRERVSVGFANSESFMKVQSLGAKLYNKVEGGFFVV